MVTILTLIIAIIWAYFTIGDIDVLSWQFTFFFVYLFLQLYLMILIVGIIGVGGLFVIYSLFHSDFIDDWLLFKVREHKMVWLWIVLILFITFCTTIMILLLRPWFGMPEFEEMIKYCFILIFSGEGVAIGFMVAVEAQKSELPKFSSALNDAISSKLIFRYPESAIREAFAFFEERLRQKNQL